MASREGTITRNPKTLDDSNIASEREQLDGARGLWKRNTTRNRNRAPPGGHAALHRWARELRHCWRIHRSHPHPNLNPDNHPKKGSPKTPQQPIPKLPNPAPNSNAAAVSVRKTQTSESRLWVPKVFDGGMRRNCRSRKPNKTREFFPQRCTRGKFCGDLDCEMKEEASEPISWGLGGCWRGELGRRVGFHVLIHVTPDGVGNCDCDDKVSIHLLLLFLGGGTNVQYMLYTLGHGWFRWKRGCRISWEIIHSIVFVWKCQNDSRIQMEGNLVHILRWKFSNFKQTLFGMLKLKFPKNNWFCLKVCWYWSWGYDIVWCCYHGTRLGKLAIVLGLWDEFFSILFFFIFYFLLLFSYRYLRWYKGIYDHFYAVWHCLVLESLPHILDPLAKTLQQNRHLTWWQINMNIVSPILKERENPLVSEGHLSVNAWLTSRFLPYWDYLQDTMQTINVLLYM